jgi:uncharacterized protein YhbP (UPF0306 family)
MENNFIKKRILEILEKGYLLSLGTVDDGGVWVSEVIYIYDENFNIYWMSEPKNRHSKAIDMDSSVAGTITISNHFKEKDFGIQISGTAKKAEENKISLMIKYLKKRGVNIPSKPLDLMKKDFVWYKMTPTKIELVDQESFGYEKRELKLS